MDPKAAIVVTNLSKTFRLPHEQYSGAKQLFVNFFSRNRGYEEQKVLSNVSFEIVEGEFFGIIGRNGSGKSTLLKLLAGIYTPDTGSVQVNGTLSPFIELGVGFNPELTGRENVFMNGALLGFSRKEVDGMYDDIVSFAELEKYMDQKLKNYSSGMQVRLAFSIAIRAKGDILLLDEVLAVGDAAFQQKCFQYFEELKREKKTVVLVTHDMSSASRFCDRAIYVKDGAVTQYSSVSEVAEVYKLENIESQQNNAAVGLTGIHKLTTSIKERDKDKITFSFQYDSEDDTPMYVGFSVTRDGISVAEMTTSLSRPLKGNGVVTYELDLTQLNFGVYLFTSVLCGMENRNLLAIGGKPLAFSIKGTDTTRGAAIRLADSWKYQA